jgi:hypothetical protein
MDRKPQIQPQRYPPQKNFNKNYISESKIDNDYIDTTYSNFSSGEYSNILEIIEKNEILNFRNTKGETLIHAILKNPSTSFDEHKILDIVQKLVHKNVSINAMNEYNQTAMHLASIKGYYEIINYLISLKSDFDKIDNYGNGSIHYLINNFVSDCKQEEYYKYSNKNKKKSLKMDKYEIMTDNFLIFFLAEAIETHSSGAGSGTGTGTITNVPKYLFDKLRQLVKYYKFYKVSKINNIVDDSKLKFYNLYKKHNLVSLEPDIKNILFDSVTEFNKLYVDLNFVNELDKSGKSKLINDNTLTDVLKYVITEKITCSDDYNTKITELKKSLISTITAIKLAKAHLISLYKILFICFYIHTTIDVVSTADSTKNKSCDAIKKLTEKIINNFFTDSIVNFYNFDNLINNDDVIDENKLLLDECYFIRTYILDLSDTQDAWHDPPSTYSPVIQPLPLTIDKDRSGTIIMSLHNDNSTIGASLLITVDYIKANFMSGSLASKKCKLTALINILNYSNKYIKIIEDIDLVNTIEIYQYSYFNHINEIIINIANNLVIFKKEYESLNIDTILNDLSLIDRPLQHIRDNIYGILLSQCAWFPETDIYNMRNPDDKTKLNTLFDFKFNNIIVNLKSTLSIKVLFNIINDIYNKLAGIKDANNNFIECINKHYSLKYLESFTKLIELPTFTDTIKLDNFFINNFYPNNSIFPIDLVSYQIKYFNEYNFTSDALIPIKKDLLKIYYDYDFNQLFSSKTSSSITINVVKLQITGKKFKNKNITININVSTTKFKTGYQLINYVTPVSIPLSPINNKGIFSARKPFKAKITPSTIVKWLKLNTDEFSLLNDPIPIISLNNVKYLIQLLAFKIINLLSDPDINAIISNTQTKLKDSNVPKNILKSLDDGLNYLLKIENIILAKNVIIEKLIIFMNSYIRMQINQEINDLLSTISSEFLISPFRRLEDDKIINDVKSEYEVKLKKYTLQTMIPELLKKTKITILGILTDALIGIDSGLLIKSGERKLLLNKCIINNKIDLLKDNLFGKINLRVLDKNGNTILNRLIDQYNEYAVSKVLELDPEIYTYQNNRGQNSIEYLNNVINSIDISYTWEALNKRINMYESDLQVWIKSTGSFEEIELDESKHIIYNIILNSLYLFNECIWLVLLKAPNGWKYEDKIKLKHIIAKAKTMNIMEKLLINSLTDEDKNIIKTNITSGSLNKKINDMVEELKTEIIELTSANAQLEEEKKSIGLVTISDLNIIIKKNEDLIAEKKIEIANLEDAIIKIVSFDAKINTIFSKISGLTLINEMSMDWNTYNSLVEKDLWNFYLPIVQLANNKNKSSTNKYISFYNYALLNLDYALLDDSEIKVLLNYNSKIINNIYGDYYDLEKYEDTEYNYINDTILNIIYLNVVNIIGIEMYSGLIEYLANKYTSEPRIKEVINNYQHANVIKIFDIIKKLLKNCVWDKLKSKNPDKSYPDEIYYSNDLKSTIKVIFNLNSEDDNLFFDKIINFYKGLCENIAYNINNEIVNFLNDLKKHSLLFGILTLIKNKK